jgi:hypothetical protein
MITHNGQGGERRTAPGRPVRVRRSSDRLVVAGWHSRARGRRWRAAVITLWPRDPGDEGHHDQRQHEDADRTCDLPGDDRTCEDAQSDEGESPASEAGRVQAQEVRDDGGLAALDRGAASAGS